MKEIVELGSEDDKKSTDISDQVVGKTKRGKEIVVFQTRQGYHEIKFLNGGKLPKEMVGKFIRYEDALNAVNQYLTYDQITKKK